MKKYLILLISIIALSFTSCKGLWGPHEEDIMTLVAGNFYAENKCIRGINVFFEGSKYVVNNEMFEKPYIYASWKNLNNLVIKNYVEKGDWDTSFQSTCFITDNPEYKKDGQELMDNSIFTFTYYPEKGDPIEVSFEGKELIALNKHSFRFTIDFDTQTFYPNELR